MNYCRFSLIKFYTPLPTEHRALNIKIDFDSSRMIENSVHIYPIRYNEEYDFLFLNAETKIHFPKITQDKRFILPTIERKRLEETIEYFTALLSVSNGIKTKIYSPIPYAALRADNSDEYEKLKLGNGFYFDECIFQRFRINPYKIDLNLSSDLIVDRKSGLLIMAESLNNSNLTGKFSEYYRLFEHAFKKSSYPLVDLLSEFLSTNNFNYNREEILNWNELRDKARHADLSKSKEFALESDIDRIFHRVEQAAYDVLFNKKNWHSKDSERRSYWDLPYGYLNDGDNYFIMKQSEMKLEANGVVLDRFCKYPMQLNAKINLKSDNSEYWYKKKDFELDMSRKVTVVGSTKK